VLFADLSGFSHLAEQLARRGPRGAEDLKDLLNVFFGRLVDLVHRHGGQVASFPGDAAVALWPIDAEDEWSLRMAARCGLEAQRVFAQAPPTQARQLQVRVGLGFGRTCAAHVGGVADCWHLVIAGDALNQAILALKAAQPGDVVVSQPAWSQLAPHATAHRADGAFTRLASVDTIAPPEPLPAAVAPADDGALRRYVPRSVQLRIDAGQSDWLTEFRRLTVLFVNLGRFDISAPGALDLLQRATVIVQTAVDRFGGSAGHVSVDDKGTVIDCGWGLALHAHGDDAGRTARAVLEMRPRLAAVGVDASFGIASGDVLTGLRGTAERCDFAMIGNVVVRAAALMQAAGGDAFCDAAFVDATAQAARFDALEPLALKGHDAPVEVYRLVELGDGGASRIVGRRRERQLIEARLDALATSTVGSVVVIEGDAGIGKSRLVGAITDVAEKRHIRVFRATGDPIERSSPCYVWRGIFENLLAPGGDRATVEATLGSLLDDAPSLAPFAPLLNSVLGLSLEENARSQSVTPRGRAVLTRDLLLHLLARTTAGQQIVLALDDAQWCDSASWDLAEGAADALPHVLLLIAMRTIPRDEAPQQLERLKARPGTDVLSLEALDPGDTVRLVCQLVRARRLDSAVERLILQKAEGHPFFTEELVQAIRDRGLVQVDEGVCRFRGEAAAAESVTLPGTVRVMVSNRIDQLTASEQLTAKVASVLGRTFEAGALSAIYPIAVDAAQIARHIEALGQRELIRPVAGSGPPLYEFKHAITQEVAYSMLPFAQRGPLHERAARHIEQECAAAVSPPYALLASHWSRAGIAERAVHYSELAGDDAMARFANEEAIRFFTGALAIADADPAKVAGTDVRLPDRVISGADVRRGRWRRCLGEACVNLGQWDDGWTHLEASLALMGRSLPASNLEWTRGLAAEMGRQARHWVRRPVGGTEPPDVRLVQMETVRALQRLCNVSYVTGRSKPLFYCVLAALNLAERLGPSPELAMLYTAAGNISGLVPVHRLAWAYGARALAVARELDDPGLDARVLNRTGLYRLAAGDWTACADIERAMSLADQVGDQFVWEECAALRCRAAHLRGEYRLSVRLGEQLRARATASHLDVHIQWGIDAEAWGWLYLGDHAKALERATTGLAMSERDDRISILDLMGAAALVHLYRGDLPKARSGADRLLKELRTTPRPGHFAVLGMSAAAEVYVALAGADQEARGRALEACHIIRRYAKINPPARARAQLWRGCLEAAQGKRAAAEARWSACLADAERFSLPYEAARAHYAWSQAAGVADADRVAHLDRAARGFDQLGAAFELARTMAARGRQKGQDRVLD